MENCILAIGIHSNSNIWFQGVKNLGYQLVVVNHSSLDQYPESKDYSHLIDHYHVVDVLDKKRILNATKHHNIVSVLCQPCTNDFSLLIGEIIDQLNLKGLSSQAAEIGANKYKFHKFLEKHDLPRPRYTIKFDRDMDISDVSFPCIVKPAFGAGAMGVERIPDIKGLKRFFLSSINPTWKLFNRQDFYLIQDHINATYFMGCNSVVHDGKLKILSHNVRTLEENWPLYFDENIYPCPEDGFLSTENMKIIEKMVRCLGVNNWPLKIEVFLDQNKKILSFVEVNLRPGGTNSPLAFNKILGFSYIEEQIKLSLPNEESCFSPVEEPEYGCLLIKNFQFKPGKIRSIKWPKDVDGVVSLVSKIKPGSEIIKRWDVWTASQNGELVLVGKNYQDLQERLHQFVEKIELEYS